MCTHLFFEETQIYVAVIMERSGLGRITWWSLSPPAHATFKVARFFLRGLVTLAGDGDGDGDGDGVETEVVVMVELGLS